jgi:glycosyltransferase involved in cell wall biosynthesis
MEYRDQLKGLKVAIVHDWLVSLGGAERVVESLLKLFPQADVYTSVYDPKKLSILGGKKVHTTFLQRWPLAKSKHQLFASLRPLAFESLDLKGYDLVISSSSAESKGVITATETLHISYIHTPIRYYWSGYNDYYNNPGFGALNPIVRLLMPSMVKKLKRWDYSASQRPDFIIANSNEVKKRIKKYYNRNSEVINPPVDVERFQLKKSKDNEEYYLVVSRLVPYKRVDLAINACNNLNKKLIVAGRGPELKNLKKLARNTVEFVENPTDKQITELYSKAKGFIFSAEEDFGITPVEAMACGVPVICYGKGGATETVIDGKTGIYHSQQTVKSLQDALDRFESTDFDKNIIRKRAEEFSEQRFISEIGGCVLEKIKKQIN